MNDMPIADATPDDLAGIERLLEATGLSTAGTTGSLPEFVVAREHGRVVAAACLEPHGTVGLLRSVATAADARNRGLATRMVTVLLNRASARGYRAVYLLTDTAERYFARFGFRRLARAQVSPEVRQAGQFQSQTCASAVTMGLGLTGGSIEQEGGA
jgi:amino-acid N-acetyltransferase